MVRFLYQAENATEYFVGFYQIVRVTQTHHGNSRRKWIEIQQRLRVSAEDELLVPGQVDQIVCSGSSIGVDPYWLDEVSRAVRKVPGLGSR